MSRVIKLMNIAAPIAAFALLLLISPLYFAFDLLRSIKRHFSSENVADKVVLITGASSGIGESLAYEYPKRGARLALAARKEDRVQLEAVAEKAKKIGSPDLLAICIDVSKPHDCSNLVDQTVHHFGQLDHLVNNAGISKRSMLEDCNEVSNFTPIMDVNFWGSVNCTYSALPHLRKTKGKIVVISSVASWMPTPKRSFYNASKAALISFFETLRVEFGSNIGITIVTPGFIRTKMTKDGHLEEDTNHATIVREPGKGTTTVLGNRRRQQRFREKSGGDGSVLGVADFRRVPPIFSRDFRRIFSSSAI